MTAVKRIRDVTSPSPARVPPKRRKVEWTGEEIENLKKGVEMFGVGKWKKILETFPFNGRTNVDLKDKWRNLQGPRHHH